MESTDKFREWTKTFYRDSPRMIDGLCKFSDEFEAEIAERYMELPVDAEGVPIHVGDVIQFVNEQGGTGAKVEVCAVSKHYVYYGEGKHFYRASMCRHVKPRTVEDVLRDMLNAYDRHEDGDMPYSFIAKYADELRNMGVGE